MVLITKSGRCSVVIGENSVLEAVMRYNSAGTHYRVEFRAPGCEESVLLEICDTAEEASDFVCAVMTAYAGGCKLYDLRRGEDGTHAVCQS